MIEFKNVAKSYTGSLLSSKTILENVNFNICKGEKIGFLGLNGAGKSTICKMISGAEPATKGKINITSTTSWPIGIFNSLSPNLTGNENILFISKIYGLEYKVLREQVAFYSQLKSDLNQLVSTYSSGMRARLAFFLAFSIDFDFYVCDEVTSVGDKAFRKIADEFFKEVTSQNGLILCSHSEANIKKHVDYVYLVHNNTVSKKFNLDEGIQNYNKIVQENAIK